jgi:hypothetical protein
VLYHLSHSTSPPVDHFYSFYSLMLGFIQEALSISAGEVVGCWSTLLSVLSPCAERVLCS